MGDADEALQVLHHGEREGELVGALLDFCQRQRVVHHELGQVTYDLGRRCHLEEEEDGETQRERESRVRESMMG